MGEVKPNEGNEPVTVTKSATMGTSPAAPNKMSLTDRLTLGGLLLALITLIIAWLAWRYPVEPVEPKPKPPERPAPTAALWRIDFVSATRDPNCLNPLKSLIFRLIKGYEDQLAPQPIE